jgi:uncharacterized protein YndB with AHSA1/START domain
MRPNENLDLEVSRIINAPPSAVWTAWKEPEHLAKWWAPAPVVTIVHKLEFRPGGAFATTMRLADGTAFSGESCFLEVVENERIAFTDALRGGWRPNAESFFSAIITLEPHPEGTRYTAVALHKNDEDRQKHADMGFLDGWGTCIEQLGKLAAQLK